MGRLRVVGLVSLASVLGSACGPGGGPSPADDQAFMSSFCELSGACCVKNGNTDPNLSVCKAVLQITGFSRDGALRAACLADLKQLAAADACLPEQWKLDDPCVRTFNEPGGSQPPGGPCAHSIECAGTPGQITFCQENSFGPGICMRMARGKANQATCLADLPINGGFFGPLSVGGAWPPAVTDGVFAIIGRA